MEFHRTKLFTLVLLGLSLLPGSAFATLTLGISDTIDTLVFVEDGGINDASSENGVLTYIGGSELDGWITSVNTGITYPAAGSPEAPLLHLNSVDVSSSSNGSLIVALSETGFTGSPGDHIFDFNVGGVLGAGGNLTLEAWMGTGLFGLDTLLGSFNFADSGSFSNSLYNLTTAADDYSLTIIAYIDHTLFGVSSFDAEISVPEPGTLALFGLGLLGLGFVKRRRRT